MSIHGEGLRLRDGDVAVVEVDGIRRFDDVVEVVLRDAADGELRVLAGEVAGDVHAGRERGDVEALLYTERLELLARERADGDADVLDVLLALLRGDDDFFEHSLCQCGRGDAGGDSSDARGREEEARLEHGRIPELLD